MITPQAQRVMSLDAVLSTNSGGKFRIREKAALINDQGQSSLFQKETCELTLDFSNTAGLNIRVGAKATVWKDGDMLTVHLVIFEGDFTVGRSLGWVPLEQTMSLAVASEETPYFIDCYATYKLEDESNFQSEKE